MRRTSLCQDVVSDQTVQRPLRHEVHRSIEQLHELVLELVDREPELSSWLQHSTVGPTSPPASTVGVEPDPVC